MSSMDYSYQGSHRAITLARPCSERPDVLIVHTPGSTHTGIAHALRLVDYRVVTSNSFYQAKHLLRSYPRLLVADVRLGEFNGLHLAWYRRFIAPGPTIVISPQPDAVLEEEARRAKALWFVLPLDRQKLLEAAVTILGEPPVLLLRATIPAYGGEIQPS